MRRKCVYMIRSSAWIINLRKLKITALLTVRLTKSSSFLKLLSPTGECTDLNLGNQELHDILLPFPGFQDDGDYDVQLVLHLIVSCFVQCLHVLCVSIPLSRYVSNNGTRPSPILHAHSTPFIHIKVTTTPAPSLFTGTNPRHGHVGHHVC